MTRPGGTHFLGLPAGTIKTEPLLRTKRAIADCVRHRALALIYGDAGMGKTFAAMEALKAVSLPVIWSLFGAQVTQHEVLRRILKEATGREPDGTKFRLLDQLVRLLRKPTIVVIDEAQALNRDCMYIFRHLLDEATTKVAVILVGGVGCIERVKSDPMLLSRVYRRVEFDRMPEELVLKSIPKYHPLYAGVDLDLIREADRRCAHGCPRHWAKLTHTARDVAAEQSKDRLDREVLEMTLALIAADEV